MHSPSRPRGRNELKRLYFHRGYWWPCSLVILVPVLLRFVMFYDISFPFQSTSSIPVVVGDNLGKSPSPPVIGPDEDAWIAHNHHAKGPMTKTEIEISKKDLTKKTEIETSKESDQYLTMRPNGQDLKDGNVLVPEDDKDMIKVGGVADSQLREIGERIKAVKEFHGQTDNVEEISTLKNGDDLRKTKGQQRADADQRQIDTLGQVLDKKTEKERQAEAERKDAEERMAAAEADEQMMVAVKNEAKDERGAEEAEAEEKRFVKELETAEETEEAAKVGKGAKQIEIDEAGKADEVMIAAKERDADKQGRAGEERERAEDQKAAQKRESDDEKGAAEVKEASQGKEAEEESKADEQVEAREKEAAQDKEADEGRVQPAEEVWKADEQAATRGKGEEEKSAAGKTEADENNDEGQRQSQQRDVEEQKIASDHEKEGVLKLDQSTKESNHIEENNPVEEKEKEEEKHEDSNPRDGDDGTGHNDQWEGESIAAEECDLFDGDWEFDLEGPMYTNSTCFYIQGDHDCMSNGRQDTGFQNWRWKPRGCDLPRLDAWAFMEAVKGKSIGYVGDSLARNQMQSMLCLLSMVERPVCDHDDPVSVRWVYERYKVTLTAVWSPYLLKESQEGILGFEKGQSVLYLDVLDPVWTSMLPQFDIVVFSVGQWYFKPSVYIMQDEVVGCHYCPNLNLTEISFVEVYRGGLRLGLEKMGAGDWKGNVILSTFAAGHAEQGEQCRRERPLEKEEFERLFQGMHYEMRDVVSGEFNRMMVNEEIKLNNKDVHLDFLDVSKLSLLRADGHPGPFYRANPFEGKGPDELVFNDCLHWCLPGPIDTWNQLLVKILHRHL